MTPSAPRSNTFGRHHGHATSGLLDRRGARRLPPPDPATRAELQRPAAMAPNRPPRRRTGVRVLVARLALLVLAASSAVVLSALTSPLIAIGVSAAVGLAAGAALRRRQDRDTGAATAHLATSEPDDDLRSLTAQIAAVLTQLRHEHGLAYRSRTWIDDVLPSLGGPVAHPKLTRDLLAVAALDAGGIRADVAGLARAHDHHEIVTAARTLHSHLQRVLDACDATSSAPTPPPSDRSGWLP